MKANMSYDATYNPHNTNVSVGWNEIKSGSDRIDVTGSDMWLTADSTGTGYIEVDQLEIRNDSGTVLSGSTLNL